MPPATGTLRALSLVAFFLSFNTATAQSCTNDSISSVSGCLCPPGFGGANCSQPACGSTIFDGSHRSLTSPSAASGGFPNLTSSDCSCPSGWTGLGCNVCTSASACQSGYAAVSGNASTTTAAQVSGLNDTLYSQRVNLAAKLTTPHYKRSTGYPLQSVLNIQRTFNASFSPLKNVSGTVLSPNRSPTVYAQLFYSGVEQFFCTASSCTQSSTSTTDLFYSTVLITINSLSGPLTIACDNTNNCHFQQEIINGLFGSSGLPLQGCTYGECVTQTVIDSSNGTSTSGQTTGSSPLSPGVIAGLAVVGGLVGIGLVAVVWGWILRRAAILGPSGAGKTTLGDVACSNGDNGLENHGYSIFSQLPTYPYIGRPSTLEFCVKLRASGAADVETCCCKACYHPDSTPTLFGDNQSEGGLDWYYPMAVETFEQLKKARSRSRGLGMCPAVDNLS
ncbi:hypothetical protein L210DRAFT_3506917 [Boletus edulis BED1]|uniref:EGF-like domain-containing protein n=1 Tax=Boletus edulis BED1 TaxID=1328754 RepID=A0AAD4GAG9_BOLED|nr:hypothetical protein L210DRAFT_3506917 [Boletus edulis BED1]